MEARANYVAVGAFVLLVLAGILVGSLGSHACNSQRNISKLKRALLGR